MQKNEFRMMTADRIVCQHNVALSVSADGEFMFFHGCLISQNYSFALASPGKIEFNFLSFLLKLVSFGCKSSDISSLCVYP